MTKRKSPAQLDREITEVLADQPARKKSRPSHAVRSDRAAELIESYKPWASTYSNEDLDRERSLANRLTAIDREEGRPTPPVGFSAERYKQAKLVVRDANLYGEKQQSLRGKGRHHATQRGKHTIYDLVEVNARTKKERVLHEHFSTKADAKEAADEYRARKRPDVTYRIKSRKVSAPPYRWNPED